MLTSALRLGKKEREAAIPIPIMAPATKNNRRTRGTLCNHGTIPTTKMEILYMSRAEVVTMENPSRTRRKRPKFPTREISISAQTPPKLPVPYAASQVSLAGIAPPMAAPNNIIKVKGT